MDPNVAVFVAAAALFVVLATLLLGLFAWLRADLTSTRKELRGDISLLGKEVAGLRERMAHMEGLLEGLRDAVAGKRAA